MKFIELNKNLKQEIKSIYSLIGDDFFLIKQAFNNIKSFVVKELEEFNYVKLDGSQVKLSELDAILSTLPMCNDYRLVYITDLREEVIKFINKYDFASSSYLVLVTDSEKVKNAEIVDCTKLDKIDISKYILNTIAKSNLSIEEQALDYLIDACGQEMTRIVTELNKIISYAKDEKVITLKEVSNLVSDSTEFAIYSLTNAIDNKDYAKYQEIINSLSKSNSFGEIFAYMGKYFRRMQYVAINKNDSELSAILNLKPYAVKKAREYVNRNGIKYYINLYQKYTDLDLDIKSGKVSVYNALYELIF